MENKSRFTEVRLENGRVFFVYFFGTLRGIPCYIHGNVPIFQDYDLKNKKEIQQVRNVTDFGKPLIYSVGHFHANRIWQHLNNELKRL